MPALWAALDHGWSGAVTCLRPFSAGVMSGGVDARGKDAPRPLLLVLYPPPAGTSSRIFSVAGESLGFRRQGRLWRRLNMAMNRFSSSRC